MSEQRSKIPEMLSERLDFIGLDSKALAAAANIRPQVERHLPLALDKFYEKLVTVPAVSRFFGSSEQMGRAKGAQSGHWTNIATGKFDAEYLESATRIGLRHARIGLEPRWYIGGYALIVENIIKGVCADFLAERRAARPKHLMGRNKSDDALDVKDVEMLAEGLATVVKSVMVDIDIAVSIYFDKLTEEAAARDKAAAEKVAHAVASTGEVLRDLAEGDLTSRITAEFEADMQPIKDDTNAVADRLTAIMTQLGHTSKSLRTATSEILSGANDLADRTTRQAANIEETSASMEQIAATVEENAKRANQASVRIRDVAGIAEQGGEVMGRATGAMDRITDSSSKISGIIGVIDDIAFQTNLLALNASVEAARAGEAGKGFSVVAVEVRRLAQSAAEASREIKVLIDASAEEVRLGSGFVTDAAAKLLAIVEGVRECTTLTVAIAEANRGQSDSVEEVNVAIRQMDEMTQQNAALVEQTNAAIEQTEGQAAELDGIVSRFRIDPSFREEGKQRRRA